MRECAQGRLLENRDFFSEKMVSRFECIAANKNYISDNSRNKSNKMLQPL